MWCIFFLFPAFSQNRCFQLAILSFKVVSILELKSIVDRSQNIFLLQLLGKILGKPVWGEMARKVLGKKKQKEFGKEKYQCIILYVNITLSILGVFVRNKLLPLVIYLHPHCGYSQHFFRPAEENPMHSVRHWLCCLKIHRLIAYPNGVCVCVCVLKKCRYRQKPYGCLRHLSI